MSRKNLPLMVLAAFALPIVASGCTNADSNQAPTPIVVSTPANFSETPGTTPSAPPSTLKSDQQKLSLAYVAVGDKGKHGEAMGCNDSLLLIDVKTPGITADSRLQLSFNRLLSDDRQYPSGSDLYNALWRSDLVFDQVTTTDDVMTVRLKGDVVPDDTRDKCDAVRIIAQLKRTATAAEDVDDARILVDGISIDDLLLPDEAN